jgi:hypothetical protein
MSHGPRSAFPAFYGLRGKQDGFFAAQAYASAHNLKYTVIDILVTLEKQNPGLMKPEQLKGFDFLNFSRASRPTSEQVSEWLLESKNARTRKSDVRVTLQEKPLRIALAEWPFLVDEIADLQPCRHMKVIAFPTMTSLSDQPISIGHVPHFHWDAIAQATCRLNPTVRITLNAPV